MMYTFTLRATCLRIHLFQIVFSHIYSFRNTDKVIKDVRYKSQAFAK